MTTCAEWKTRWEEADKALHALRTGTKVVTVRSGEKTVEYSPTGITELARYVDWLAGKVAACSGESRSPRRVIGVIPTN